MKIANVLHARKFPSMRSKKYKRLHKQVNSIEKKRYGKKCFNTLFRLGQSLPAKEVLGHVSKSGQVWVSKKVPKRLRGEVAFHERELFKRYINER